MQETPIIDLLYDVMEIFDNNEIVVYSAIKSIHRRTNIEHIINHIDTQISLEQYRNAFIQIMGFSEERINYFTHLSKIDFRDISIIMHTTANYFDSNDITHSNLRKCQEREYLDDMVKSSHKIINKLKVSTPRKSS